jgi:hypothetical protein
MPPDRESGAGDHHPNASAATSLTPFCAACLIQLLLAVQDSRTQVGSTARRSLTERGPAQSPLGATRVRLAGSQADAVPNFLPRLIEEPAAPGTLEMPKPATRAGREHPAGAGETD